MKDTIAQSNDSAAGLNVDITNVPARTFGNSKRAALLSAQGAVDTLSPLEDSTSIQAQYTFRSYAPSPQLIYASDEEEANKFVRQLEG